MDEPILDSQKRHRTETSKPVSIIYIFILITTVNFAVSQPSAIDCSLDFQSLSSSNSSGCEEGDWGGFLHNNCCEEAFQGYLYALAKRANQTGEIYLNSSEQINCLNSMKSFVGEVYGCGIEKLTRGVGGCSEFSVADVNNRLGDELRRVNETCELVSSNGESEQLCSSCMRTWEGINGTHSISTNAKSTNVDTAICRFAVLVSSISSRIEDEVHVNAVFRCLEVHKTNTATEGKGKNNSSAGIWMLIGGIVGIAVVMVFIAKSVLSKRCFKSTPAPKNDAFKDVLLKAPACQKVPIKEVYSATDNLNDLNYIGEGTARREYKGIMSNNQHVAIKHIINDGSVETFVREVTSLAHVRHPNLVALLGCCVREDECFIIYELCPNGNLSEWLFGIDKVLTWIQRLEIAIDSARGLWFLHTYPEGCIVHHDIKPTNILLGTDFEAKLSDFGLSKVIDLGETYVSSEVRGTFGYVDPEYRSNHRVNSSGDVYSFGIVLLQLLSGKKVVNMNLKRPMSLNKMAKELTRGGSIAEFADPKLDGEYSAEAFDLTLKLAMSFTSLKQQRPSMESIFKRLEEALDISTRAKACTPETTPDQSSTW